MSQGGGLLGLAPPVLWAGLVLPIAAGLLGTAIPAFGSGGFAAVLDWPGLPRAMALSIGTGLLSTAIALALTILILAALSGTRLRLMRRLLSPLLALPHAAAALGLAFLVAPSGWIARLLSPWATGWTAPPDLLILSDPMGLALTLGLVAKEVPFLLLIALAALPQCDAARRGVMAASLGYGRVWGFLLAVLPTLYRRLRLPVFAVLAYAMTSVEMAMILGPTLPPPLAVQITDWMTDPSLRHLPTAAAAALIQLALVALALGLWLLAERLAARALPRLAAIGWRLTAPDRLLIPLTETLGLALALFLGLGLVTLGLWSLAGLWSFPDALPETLTLKTWAKAGPALAETAGRTLALALGASLAALAFVLAVLEAEARQGRLAPAHEALIYLPLLMPQIAFLPGVQVALLSLCGGTQNALAVLLVHLLFVLPYVFLSLAPAFRGLDPRFALAAQSLGSGPDRVFWRVKLPLLMAPLLTALALGLAVSVGQYLPTLLIGGGRVETLTTEAVALSSGGDRRLIGAYGLMQALLPAMGFAFAILLPRLIYARRKAMTGDPR